MKGKSVKLFRMVAAVVLATVVAAFTVVGYLAVFVAMSQYPIQSTAVVAAAAAGLWFKSAAARRIFTRRRAQPPDPAAAPEAAPAGPPDGDEQLRAVLGPQAYEELRALGARDATGA